MKYIRTKDGELYFNLGETQNGIIVEYNYLGDGLDLAINYDAIKNQADTIEELCDEIVEVIDGKAQVVYADISFNDLAIAKIRDKNNAIVYGAIWTDKGLIYVAKMNEEGELELIWK